MMDSRQINREIDRPTDTYSICTATDRHMCTSRCTATDRQTDTQDVLCFNRFAYRTKKGTDVAATQLNILSAHHYHGSQEAESKVGKKQQKGEIERKGQTQAPPVLWRFHGLVSKMAL